MKDKKDSLVFIKHIMDSIEKIEKFTKGVDEDKFNADEKL